MAGRAHPPVVIGLDLGTSAVKGLLVDADGRVVGRATRSHRREVGAGGRVEVQAPDVVAGARAVIGTLARRAAARGVRVRAMCAGGSGDEAVWLDVDGIAVAPVPLSLDTRGADAGDAIADGVGRSWFMATTGLPPSGAYPLARMRWLATERPDLAARVHRLLSWPEYLAFDLGVPVLAEPTLAARTAGWRLRTAGGDYEPRLLRAAGVRRSVLAPVVPTGMIAGAIEPDIARALGLPLDTAWVVGGFDQAMATLGAGVTKPGIAHVGAGSWEAVTVLADTRPYDELVAAGYTIGPSIGADGRWSVMASGPGAVALAWFGQLGVLDAAAAARRAFALASHHPDRPSGLVVVPDLNGAAAPAPDPAARGAIAGLSLGDGPDRIAMALLEGVALGLAARLDRLADAGLPAHELRVTGGGVRDRRWRQLKADVTGLPVRAVRPADAGTAAAAALAAAAVGLAPDLDRALAATVTLGRPLLPRPRSHDAYRALGARAAALRTGLGAVQRAGPGA